MAVKTRVKEELAKNAIIKIALKSQTIKITTLMYCLIG